MKLSTPRWWYRREDRIAPISRALLTPLSWIWAAVTARRIARGQPHDPGIPVICVGNLTVGGTGKTPVVREIAARLGAHILTRGYGGRLTGPLREGEHHLTVCDTATGRTAETWIRVKAL